MVYLVEVPGASGEFRMLNGSFLDLGSWQIFWCYCRHFSSSHSQGRSRDCVGHLRGQLKFPFVFAKMKSRSRKVIKQCTANAWARPRSPRRSEAAVEFECYSSRSRGDNCDRVGVSS